MAVGRHFSRLSLQTRWRQIASFASVLATQTQKKTQIVASVSARIYYRIESTEKTTNSSFNPNDKQSQPSTQQYVDKPKSNASKRAAKVQQHHHVTNFHLYCLGTTLAKEKKITNEKEKGAKLSTTSRR